MGDKVSSSPSVSQSRQLFASAHSSSFSSPTACTIQDDVPDEAEVDLFELHLVDSSSDEASDDDSPMALIEQDICEHLSSYHGSTDSPPVSPSFMINCCHRLSR